MSTNEVVARVPASPAEGWVSLWIALASTLFVVCATYNAIWVGLVVLPLCAAACWQKPWQVLLAMVYCLPVSPLIPWSLPVHDVFALARIGFFVAVFMNRVVNGDPIRSWLLGGVVTKAILVYFFIAVLSVTVFNSLLPLSMSATMRLVSYVSIYYVVIALVRSEFEIHRLLKALMVTTLFVDTLGLLQLLVGGRTGVWDLLYPASELGVEAAPWTGRIPSTFIQSNSLAGFLNLVIPFGFAYWFLQKDVRQKKFGAIVTVTTAVVLLLTESRGALAAFIMTIVILLAVKSKSTLAFVKKAGVSAALAGVAALVIVQFLQRFTTVEESSTLGRLLIWAAAFQLFRSAPWIGIGFGNFKELYANVIPLPPRVIDAHNLYLQLLSETGVVGFVAFVVLVVITLRIGIQRIRIATRALDLILGFGVVAAISSILVHGTVDYIFHVCPQFSTLLFILLGLLTCWTHNVEPVSAY